MYFDSHVHSAASPDSEMCPVEAIATLKQKGLGVIFTEHVDFDTKGFVCDFNIYPSTYAHLRSDSVLLGLEIGLSPDYFDLNKKTADADYDFIIGSVHRVYGRDVYFDFPTNDAASFIRRYLTYSREMVELCGIFDAFGHVDYVARYVPEAGELFCYDNFAEEFDALLKALAVRDIAIEINTARFEKLGADGVRDCLLPIYRRFAQLGGMYCTIGSDAHDVGRLGSHMDMAINLAIASKLKIVYYKKRVRHFCGA